MSKKEISVKFRTITPLWTGNAWQDNTEIRPSSLMGSLRFWFEVICYFSGICDKKDFNNGRFENEVNKEKFKKCISEKGNSFEAKIECLLGQGIPLPSIIFGSTDWRSLIEIKEIKYLDDYCFGNKLSLPTKICINKSNHEIKENNDCPNRSNRDWSVFYFANPYFYGKFQVLFIVEEKILESIFYPLLTFMDKYGFWGGKWNIGYGRLKVLEVKVGGDAINNWEKEIFEFGNLSSEKYEDKDFTTFFENEISEFDSLTRKENKIQLVKTVSSENSFTGMIKALIKTKTQKRAEFTANAEVRHKIFGTTRPPPNDKNLLSQGSKILPFIHEENEQLRGGFLSIAGLLNLEGKSNG